MATIERHRRPDDPTTTFERGGRTAAIILGTLMVVAGGCARSVDSTARESVEPDVAADDTVDMAAGFGFLRDQEIYMPQFAQGGDGTLYASWSARAEGRGADLFLSRMEPGNGFTPPVRVNDIPGGAGGGDLDEGRPAIAVGSDGVVAVAWSARGEIRGAMSHDYGASFAASQPLNSGESAYRGFVGVDVDAEGVAHAAWIDGRFAPRGAEEPAELFYARFDGTDVTEINLTEDQEDSICGCCRVDVQVRPDQQVVIAFRNTGGGYRDIHRVVGSTQGEFGAPRRLGPPMWELNGCPVFGPLNVGSATLWSEASTGKRRLLAATDTNGEFEIVIEDNDEWRIERPPRIIAQNGGEALLLLPGRPGGVLLRGAGTRWSVVAEDLPVWAMSGALIDGNLLLVGAIDGLVQLESHPFDF